MLNPTLIPYVFFDLFLFLILPSATYTHIQPHSVLQQKQVVFQQQIAIHQHRQSQLVHASAHLQLAQQQPQAPSQQGMQATPAQQTLVVQPMLQTPEATLPTKAPVPIQPKQPGKGVPPLNLQGHLAAKPTQSARPLPTPPPNQPHIPVQLVGARQQGPAQALALGAPQVPSQGSSLTQITLPQSPAPVPSAVSGAVQEAQAAFYGVLQVSLCRIEMFMMRFVFLLHFPYGNWFHRARCLELGRESQRKTGKNHQHYL